MADNTTTRFTVFALKEERAGEKRTTLWVRAGSAWRNRDASINVYLDVLPLDGKLHLREELVGQRELTSAPVEAPEASSKPKA